MPILIHIVGFSNSGKSSSIRLFLENRGIFFPDIPKDFAVIIPIHKHGKIWNVGVASGGDTSAIVNNNFKFFNKTTCDIIVFATKSSKSQSYRAAQNHIQNLNPSTTKVIKTSRFQSPSKAQISTDNIRVANEIWSHIP